MKLPAFIQNDAEYMKVLKRIEELSGAKWGSIENKELRTLVFLAINYEDSLPPQLKF